MKVRAVIQSLLISMAVLSGSCNGGGGGGGYLPPPAPTYLSVTAVSPQNGALGVQSPAEAVANFWAALDPAQLFQDPTHTVFNEEMFHVRKKNTDSNVVGDYQVRDGNKQLAFQAENGLEYETTYVASVSGSLKSASGLSMQAPFSWEFTTGPQPEISVVSSVPASGAVVPLMDQSIEVTLNVIADPATVTAGSFLLRGPSGPVAGTITVDRNKLKFDPTPFLNYGTPYTIELTDEIRGIRGEVFPAGTPLITIPFRTEVAKIIAHSPSAGQVVGRNTAIDLDFNFHPDPATVGPSTVIIKNLNTGGTIAGTFSTNLGRVHFTPAAELPLNIQVEVTITLGLQGLGGIVMASGYAFTFRTEPPKVVNYSPQGTSVPLAGLVVTAQLNFDLDPTTLGAVGAIRVTNVDDAIDLTVFSTYSPATRTITIQLSEPDIRYNTAYRVTLGTSLVGQAGERLATPFSWQFTVANKALAIVSRSPAPGVNIEVVDVQVMVTFDADLDPSSVSVSDATLTTVNGGLLVNADVVVSGRSIVIRPSARLQEGTRYEVTISNAIRGARGETPTGIAEWTFSVRLLTCTAGCQFSESGGGCLYSTSCTAVDVCPFCDPAERCVGYTSCDAWNSFDRYCYAEKTEFTCTRAALNCTESCQKRFSGEPCRYMSRCDYSISGCVTYTACSRFDTNGDCTHESQQTTCI